MIASKHLVCASCSSWVQFGSSGCTNSWAEMGRGASAFTCKGCRQMARLVGEVGDIRQMMESMKRMVTGHGLEERRRNRGSSGNTGKADENEKCERVTTPDNSSTEESRNEKETAERSYSEDRGSVIEIEGEHGTYYWRKLVGSCWMGTEYVQGHRCLQHTDTRRTRMRNLYLQRVPTRSLSSLVG